MAANDKTTGLNDYRLMGPKTRLCRYQAKKALTRSRVIRYIPVNSGLGPATRRDDAGEPPNRSSGAAFQSTWGQLSFKRVQTPRDLCAEFGPRGCKFGASASDNLNCTASASGKFRHVDKEGKPKEKRMNKNNKVSSESL